MLRYIPHPRLAEPDSSGPKLRANCGPVIALKFGNVGDSGPISGHCCTTLASPLIAEQASRKGWRVVRFARDVADLSDSWETPTPNVPSEHTGNTAPH